MMGTPGNRSTEPGLQGLQNRKAARQWAAFFAITLPRQSSTIKKIRKPPYSSGGALGFHRNGPTMRGRALDCCRNRGRAGTNPGTPERPSETGTAALRTGQAITLYFFPAATFIDHPAVSGTPRTPLQRFSGTAFLFRPFFPAVFIVILWIKSTTAIYKKQIKV